MSVPRHFFDKFHGMTPKEVSDATGMDTGPESMVQEQFRDEVDINAIVRRYGIATGVPVPSAGAMYGDFTGITDFESAVDLVKNTEGRFMALPAEVREKFLNNPGNLVRFASESTPEEFEAVFKTAPAGAVADVVDAAVKPDVVVAP